MSDAPGYAANLRRGQLLRYSGRYKEACRFFGEAIQADPKQAEPYLEIALAQSSLPGGRGESLRAIDQAVALEPLSSYYLGYKASLLNWFCCNAEAIKVAKRALELDPNNVVALIALADVHLHDNWQVEAERLARRILELQPGHVIALNLLAKSLRIQGRLAECRQVLEVLLAQVPDNAEAHATAGYEALRARDRARARRHFLQALRCNPNSDEARCGLLHTLRQQIWIYRVNMHLIRVADFQELRKRPLWVRMLFLFFTISTGGAIYLLFIVYLPLILTLVPLSNFFLLLDPVGRRVLSAGERRKGLFTGGIMLMATIGFFAAGFWLLALFLALYLGLFALGVCLPQWIDARIARREKEDLAVDKSALPCTVGI